MADDSEPRRSGRATKGQYTKDRDIPEEGPGGKRKGKGKAAKAKEVEEEEVEESEEIIRCICGKYEEAEDEQRDMICCDQCAAWQHNDCMLLPYTTENAPDQYFCEQCRPQDHKDLLAAIERGEKPWEEVARKREEAALAKKKKGGKRGRKSGGRASELQEDAAPTKSEQASPASTGGQKRKLEDTASPQVDTKKARSVSARAASPPVTKTKTAAPPPSGPIASKPEELTPAGRKSAALALIKLFTEQAKAAQKSGSYAPPKGQSVPAVANTLGLAVEHAMYAGLVGSGDLNDGYKTQLRTIMHNVKANTVLRDRVLSGELPSHAFAVMNAEHMASEEQQQRDAAIKAEAEKQAMIVQDQGPRIRRTHKGDEYVDEADQIASEPTYPQRRESQVDTEMKSPTQMSPSQAEKHLFSPATRKPSSINTQVRRPSGAPDRRSSSNFNINEVWSSVQSPDHDQQFAPIQHRPAVPPSGPGAQADAEIDELLKDEDNESEPYSPKDVPEDGDIVWNGRLDMEPIAGFRGYAKITAGANAQGLGLTWDSLMPPSISINGRIDTKRADTYLCGLRYSSTTDVVVVAVRAPDHPGERESFDKLFIYFKERDRYGVVAKHSLPAVKDTYVMPIEAGATNDQKPEFLQLLDNDKIESPNPERLLLIVFVIRFSELPQDSTPASQNATNLPVGASPIAPPPSATPSSHQANPFSFNNGPAAPQNQNGNSHVGGFDGAFSPPPPQQTTPSLSAAHQVLPSDMINSPAVQQLIQQAPNLGLAEMNVLRDCIQKNPAAALDTQVLTSMLVNQQQQGSIG